MENVSNQSEQQRTQSYANEFFRKAHFLFQRRNNINASVDPILELNPDEIAFVSPAFTENFIDTPDVIEITLADGMGGDIDTADDRGVLIVTQHEDHDSVYSSLYTICAHNEIAGPFVTKDVRRLPKDQRHVERGDTKLEIIHNDAPLDES